MKKIATHFLFLAVFGLQAVIAQTDLEPGDVAILGFNSSTWSNPGCNTNQDNFSFVALVDIAAGTKIYFSDGGVRANGCLYTNEGIIEYTAPAGGIAKGTIVTIDTKDASTCNPNIIRGSGAVTDVSLSTFGFDLNTSGEQIIVFQDSDGNFSGGCIDDEYIFAFDNTGSWDADATNSHESALPPGLVDGETAVSLPLDGGYQNNAIFDCDKAGSGNKVDILASLTDPDNWEGNTGTMYDPPDCIFSFSGLRIFYVTYDQMQLTWPDPGTTEEMIIVVHEGSPVTDDPNGNDGSAWSASTVYSSGSDIGTNTYIVYKNVCSSPDTTITVTGLTEGNDYYFKIFSHAVGSSSWVEGGESNPSYETAEVQDVTGESISISGTKNVTIDWINYAGTPQSDWWDGGVMIIGKAGGAVNVNQSDLNGISESASDLSVGQDLSGYGGNFSNCFVAQIEATGTPGGSGSVSIPNLSPCKAYYFKIFVNDGDGSNDDKWSDGKDLETVNTLCPEIKVEGNNIEIADGDVTPALIDFTDFGAIMENTSLTQDYKIKNTSNGDLQLNGSPKIDITGSVFSIVAQPSSPVSGYDEVTFEIVFSAPNNCSGGPTYTETVTIGNDDTDENPYTFSITGECNNNCVSLSPASGTVGSKVIITGSGFTGATTASFNGTVATVTNQTATELEVVVPVGATTGTVTTSNPNYNSCNVFTVISAAGTCEH